MKGLVTLIVATLFLRGMVLGGESGGMEKAKATYQNICASCHGDKGDGKGVAAPTLRSKPKDFAKIPNKSEDHLFKVIKEGGPAVRLSPMMPGFAGQLKDDEVRVMARYVLSLTKAGK
jgi:mono/diheme cytochrome c family protein